MMGDCAIALALTQMAIALLARYLFITVPPYSSRCGPAVSLQRWPRVFRQFAFRLRPKSFAACAPLSPEQAIVPGCCYLRAAFEQKLQASRKRESLQRATGSDS